MKSGKHTLLLLIPLLMLLKACGSTDEVLVVRDTPRTLAADTTESSLQDTTDEFSQITIGLIEPVTNFDPLFADNLSSKRVLSLIYQSLFEMNRNGVPQPGIAENVEVSSDSLEYRFTLKTELYFHDSNLFIAGVGRQIHANDVKLAFERTAQNNVPPTASSLLMNVLGYRSYFMEQRHQFDPELRVVDGVRGIEVPDAQTILITLREKDPDFLKKLASPLLSIYPREAIEYERHSLSKSPVGTGKYTLRSLDNGRIILALNNSGNGLNDAINRIDFVYRENEGRLFQEFARNEIDWIPEISPQIIAQIISEGNLSSSYADLYNAALNNSERVTRFYLNKAAEADVNWLSDRLSEYEEYSFTLDGNYDFNSSGLIQDSASDTLSDDENQFYVVYTDNRVGRAVFTEINTHWLKPDAQLSYLNIRVVVPEASLYSYSTDEFHNLFDVRSENTPWLTVKTPVIDLYHPYVSGIEPGNVSWLLNLDNVRIGKK